MCFLFCGFWHKELTGEVSMERASQTAQYLVRQAKGVSFKAVRSVLGVGPYAYLLTRDVRRALISMGRLEDALIGLDIAPATPRRKAYHRAPTRGKKTRQQLKMAS